MYAGWIADNTCDVTDGQKFLFFDHPQHTTNGKSASLMYSVHTFSLHAYK